MSKKKYKKTVASAPNKETADNTPVADVQEQQSPELAAASEQADSHEVKTEWAPIIKDFLILLVIMGVLGFGCNLLKDAFAHKSPTDSLVSLIRKGDLKEVKGVEKDEPFLKELEEGLAKDAGFVNTRDANLRTPLMWAAYANFNNPEKAAETDTNRLYYIEALFNKNADITAVDEDGFNALHWAAWSGMRFTSYKLIKKGIDINSRENNGYTPLMLAALRGNDKVVDLLLKMGADPTLKNSKGETAAQLVNSAETAYSKRDSFIYGPVFSKEREEAYARTKKLLSKANAAVSDEELRKLEVELEIDMLASQAAARAERKIAELAKREETRATISLISLVSLKEKDIDLHHRVKGEVEAIVAMEKSLEPGTPSILAAVDAQGNSALHIAAAAGKALCCYHLVNAGMDISLKNKAGKTPLMLAAESGHTLAVAVLVSPDKPEVKSLAADAAKMLDSLPASPNNAECKQLLLNAQPICAKLKDFEFESRRLASDAAYAKAKADAEAKAKADAEAKAKAEAEAKAKAEAEAKAKEEARVRAIAEAEARTAEAVRAITEAANLKAEAERRNVEASNLKIDAARQMTEAANLKTDAARQMTDAANLKAEASKAATAAAAAKAAADKQMQDAAALKAAADSARSEAARLKAEAEALRNEAARLKAEAEAASAAPAPAPEQQPDAA